MDINSRRKPHGAASRRQDAGRIHARIRIQPCSLAADYVAAADPVVSTDWLSRRMDGDEVTILDVRGCVDTAELSPGVEQSTYKAEYGAYLAGHIPVRARASNHHVGRCCCNDAFTSTPEYIAVMLLIDARLHTPAQGAVFVDWTRDGIDTAAPVAAQLLSDAGALAAALEAKGVSADRTVVVRAPVRGQGLRRRSRHRRLPCSVEHRCGRCSGL